MVRLRRMLSGTISATSRLRHASDHRRGEWVPETVFTKQSSADWARLIGVDDDHWCLPDEDSTDHVSTESDILRQIVSLGVTIWRVATEDSLGGFTDQLTIVPGEDFIWTLRFR